MIPKYKFKIFGIHIWVMREETIEESTKRMAKGLQNKFYRRK